MTSSQGTQWKFSTVNIGNLIGPEPKGWKVRFSYTPTLTGQELMDPRILLIRGQPETSNQRFIINKIIN